MKNNNYPKINFSDIEEDLKKWENRRKRKIETYMKYTELIKYLEQILLVCDGLEKIKIKKEIKKLKKTRSKYHISKQLEVKIDKKANSKIKVLNLRKEE